MRFRCFAGIVYTCLAAALAAAQTAPVQSPPVPVRDPQALVLLTQAGSHLRSSPLLVTDVTLAASVSYTAGSDLESGTATLQALEAALSDPTISVTLAGNGSGHSRESGNPSGAEGLVLSRILPGQSPEAAAEIQKLSTMKLYLDPSSLLPVELDFNLHPDNDASRDIPVEIQFSDYRMATGVLVPFHIQKYLQHSLLLDLHVTAVELNSGLAASDFALPAGVGAPLAAPEGGQQ